MDDHIIAERYARALFEAVDKKQWDRAVEELEALHALSSEHKELKKLLVLPVVPFATKQTLLNDVLDQVEFLPQVESLFQILLKKGRYLLLKYIIREFKSIIQEARGMVGARVKSSYPLTDSERSAIVVKLSEMTGMKLECAFTEEELLICGVVAEIGHVIYDFSLKNRLRTLEKSLSVSK